MKLIKKNIDSFNKIIILSVFVLVAFIVLFYFVFIPSKYEIQSTAELISQEKISLEEKLQKGQSFAQLQKNISQIDSKKYLLDDIFLAQDEEISLIDDLENFAKNNYINISIDMPQGNKIDKRNYYILPITIKGSGNYSNILNFMNSLEKTNYFISFDTFDLSSTEEINSIENIQPYQGKKMNFSLGIKTYWK